MVQIKKMKIPIGEYLQIGMWETKKFAFDFGLTPKGDIEKTTTSHFGKMKKLRLQLAWHDSKACHKGDKIRIYPLFFDLSLIPFHDHARFECVGFPVGGILVPSGIGISPVMVPVISISTTVTLPDSTVFA